MVSEVSESDIAREFIRQSVRYVRDEQLPRIRKSVALLSEEELWWRPNSQSNSVGNLLLHLEGNVRQWIVSGVGEAPDIRERSLEFSERGPVPRDRLLDKLEQTVGDAVSVLESLSAHQFLDERHIQIYRPSVLEAILHVVEHFSHHSGQILYITKMLRGQDLRFYDL